MRTIDAFNEVIEYLGEIRGKSIHEKVGHKISADDEVSNYSRSIFKTIEFLDRIINDFDLVNMP